MNKIAVIISIIFTLNSIGINYYDDFHVKNTQEEVVMAMADVDIKSRSAILIEAKS